MCVNVYAMKYFSDIRKNETAIYMNVYGTGGHHIELD
jgi:hypothetical protein